MIGIVPQKPRQAVVEILDFMRMRGLTLNDLIQIGGEDFRSPSPMRKEKARRVEVLALDGSTFGQIRRSRSCTPTDTRQAGTKATW
jgi:hypothetical protein